MTGPTLRPLRAEDADAIAARIADWEIVRWLTAAPWPYTRTDAERFLARTAGDRGHRAICLDGALAGVVSLRPGQGLGYWLARPAWGRGVMTRVVTQVLAEHFTGSDRPVLSGHHDGNARSRAVLLRAGFRDADRVEVACVRGGTVTLQRLQLTRAAWEAAARSAVAIEPGAP